MKISTRIAGASATVVLAAACAVPVAAAAGTSHWSKGQCTSYAKKNAHVKGAHRTADNKTLKSHGCSEKLG